MAERTLGTGLGYATTAAWVTGAFVAAINAVDRNEGIHGIVLNLIADGAQGACRALFDTGGWKLSDFHAGLSLRDIEQGLFVF